MHDSDNWLDEVRLEGKSPLDWIEDARSTMMHACHSLDSQELKMELDRWSSLASEAAEDAERWRGKFEELQEKLRQLTRSAQ